MIRLVLDQGLPRRTAVLLNEAGYDCVHVGDLGMAAASDTEIIDRALRLDSVIVTLDSDFAAIVARRRSTKPSLVHVRLQHLHVQAAADLLLRILPRLVDDLAEGSIVAVTPRGLRVRKLPLPGSASDDAPGQ